MEKTELCWQQFYMEEMKEMWQTLASSYLAGLGQGSRDVLVPWMIVSIGGSLGLRDQSERVSLRTPHVMLSIGYRFSQSVTAGKKYRANDH